MTPASARARSLLSGLVILEYSEDNAAASFATRLLADLGAEVIKLEPPHGDPLRRYGYVPAGGDASCLFAYLNAGKRSVTLDATRPSGRVALQRLIEACDIVVDGHRAEHWQSLDIAFDRLPGSGRLRLALSITPFGRSGERSRWEATHLTVFHSGGEAYTFPGGISWLRYPDREPIKVPGRVGELDVGVTAAISVMAWTLGRRDASVIELAMHEAMVVLNRVDISRYPAEGHSDSRASRSFPVLGEVPCKDGWVQVMPLEQPQWERLVKAIGDPDWAHALGATPEDRLEHGEELNTLLNLWFMERTKQEILEIFQAAEVPVGAVRSMEEVLASGQLRERRFFQTLAWPEGMTVYVPGHPYTVRGVDDDQWRPSPGAGGGPPRRGGETDRILTDLLQTEQEALVWMRTAQIV